MLALRPTFWCFQKPSVPKETEHSAPDPNAEDLAEGTTSENSTPSSDAAVAKNNLDAPLKEMSNDEDKDKVS